MAKETLELIKNTEAKAANIERDAYSEADKIRKDAKVTAERIEESAVEKAKDLICIKKKDIDNNLIKLNEKECKNLELILQELEENIKPKSDQAVDAVFPIILSK